MKFCKACGTQLNDSQQFCTNCGANQAGTPQPQQPQYAPPQPQPQQPQYVPPQPTYAPPQPTYAPPQPARPQSDWDGGVLETIVNSIVASLIITFTCGIAAPWAICYMMKFIVGHAIIDGRRMTFDGDGASLFGNWIKWLLLTVITCGIYSFWVIPRMYQWIAKHIHAA